MSIVDEPSGCEEEQKAPASHKQNEHLQRDYQQGESRQVEQGLSDLLTHVIRVGNRLAAASSVDELCCQAVQSGITELGFDRMSIWLVDSERKLIYGTYGTDEQGQLRDERSWVHTWAERMIELELVHEPHQLFRRDQRPLYNDASEVVGVGEVGAAALWNGKEVAGMMYIDNLLSQQPFSEERWRIFELYASTVGHILSLKRTESALRSKEELLSQILDIMPVGVFVLSPEETLARFNRAAHEMWELDPEQLATWSPDAVWVRDRRPVAKDEWAGHQALTSGKSVLNQEIEIVKRNGARQVLLNSGVPLRDSAGALTGAIVVNQDITERKRREQQLEALARLSQVLRPLSGRRGVVEAVVDTLAEILFAQGVAVAPMDNQEQATFEAAVGVYAALAGQILPEELAQREKGSRTEVQLFDNCQDDALGVLATLPENPRYAVAVPLVSEKEVVGTLLIGFVQAPDSSMIELIGALADVTAAAIRRGHLYDEVTTQAHRLERVMESVNFGLLLLDPQRRVVLANQRAQAELARLAGVTVGEEVRELAGQQVGRFLTPSDGPSRMREIAISDAIYEITTMPVGAEGAEEGWLMVIHDVTRDRAIQSSVQQHQRLAAVGQLAAGIAHDFNNIIAVITLYAQMLQRNASLQESDQKRLHVIREQAQYASKLIRQILDFSRQTVIEKQPVDLKTLIEDSVTLWKRTLPESISFYFETNIEGPAQVLAEASTIQQALTNLAVNARDAMPEGGEVVVRLRAVTVGEDEPPLVAGMHEGQWFELDVVDNGMGIAPDDLPRIFDPFFTTKEIGKGTGLGLAQVYGIVQQHGGFVQARSKLGKGTTISLYLPVLSKDAPASHENDPHEAAGAGGETILLVEDNAPAREATTALLEMLGYRVIAAEDGRAALELFRRHADSIHLVLSDLVMPEMGGVELYRKIQAEYPAMRMLVMTGYALEEELQNLAEAGIVEWLQKPFTIRELTDAVRRVMGSIKEAGDVLGEEADALDRGDASRPQEQIV